MAKQRKSSLRDASLTMCLAISLLYIPAFANSQELLWDDARTGMTVDEVRNLYPNAVLLEKPGMFNNGMKELLNIEGLQISNIPLTIRFLFLDKQLRRVMLTVDTESDYSEFDTYVDRLSGLLRVKYGVPFEDTDKIDHTTRTVSHSWKPNERNITLSGFYIDRVISLISIIYHYELEKELNKL